MKMENTLVEPEVDLTVKEMSFPFALSRSRAELVDVAAGLKWLRHPMPYSLDHVNVYLLQTYQGWLIVDTGLDSPETRGIWEEVFSGAFSGEKIAGVYSTHHHVDHIGLAGYLTERWQVPLYMSFKEYFSLQGCPMDLQDVPWQHQDFYRKIGLPEQLNRQSLVLYDFKGEISTPPLSFCQLKDGQLLSIAGKDWRVIVGEGHAPELAMLYSAQQKILISGDQLLPRISSNVSVSPVNPD
ncbi:MAG: MBL fold metallo-hydrolase, partial [Deltaproteobacteria bacterium]